MKDIDIFSRVQYWRIFFALTFPCVIFGGAAFFFIDWIALPLAFALNVLFPFPLMLLTDRVAKLVCHSVQRRQRRACPAAGAAGRRDG